MLGEDIDYEYLPHFALVIISDGKPSDKEHQQFQLCSSIINELANILKKKLSVFCVGLGAKRADFAELDVLTWNAKLSGANGVFHHAGLSATKLGKGFSSIFSTMTSMRMELPLETVKELHYA
jgi:hypothetical protein